VSDPVTTVRDCERVQSAWFDARAWAADGRVWDDGPLHWSDGPDGGNLMFPEEIPPDLLARGLAAFERRPVGAWLSIGVDPSALAEAGFERGWAPWWMSAPLPEAEVLGDPIAIPGVQIDVDTRMPGIAFLATARAEGREIGHAWSFVHGRLAGLFDVEVDPRWRRQGIGAALLLAVQRPARWSGAEAMVLNATPAGFELYSRRGFVRIGEGITWWLHRAETPPEPRSELGATARELVEQALVAAVPTAPHGEVHEDRRDTAGDEGDRPDPAAVELPAQPEQCHPEDRGHDHVDGGDQEQAVAVPSGQGVVHDRADAGGDDEDEQQLHGGETSAGAAGQATKPTRRDSSLPTSR
jgi:GNAT superfamily N-acetyltransferase